MGEADRFQKARKIPDKNLGIVVSNLRLKLESTIPKLGKKWGRKQGENFNIEHSA
jgi:hypothetical protein